MILIYWWGTLEVGTFLSISWCRNYFFNTCTFYTLICSPSGLDISTLVSSMIDYTWQTRWQICTYRAIVIAKSQLASKISNNPATFRSNNFSQFVNFTWHADFLYKLRIYQAIASFNGAVYIYNCVLLFKSSIPTGPKWKLKVRDMFTEKKRGI